MIKNNRTNLVITMEGFRDHVAPQFTDNLGLFLNRKFFSGVWKVVVTDSKIYGCLGNGSSHIIRVEFFYPDEKMWHNDLDEVVSVIKKECQDWLIPAIDDDIIIIASQFDFFEEVSRLKK
jgi:hypothetical protein